MSSKKKSEECKVVAPDEVWDTLSGTEIERARAVLIQIAEEVIDDYVSEDSPELICEGAANE